ncbi:hypothetical protein HNQ36_001062 [Afipia massiliensis]|uniref:Uncharacterized protein n=1 Tax=Afipia massiliensis TaxID=211460 RepID=A0A840MZG6_9BRAD|nr:hypothetical protein [Afipia massiliensis]MBB5051108.1 hypothetical protein [Afipia massiliensis]
MISPSIGRIVWFHPHISERDPNAQPLAAIVAKVLSDHAVNLGVFRGDGTTFAMQNVPLLQDDDEIDLEQPFCEWMPFQKGQAAKTEALQAQVTAGTGPAELTGRLANHTVAAPAPGAQEADQAAAAASPPAAAAAPAAEATTETAT